jgi:hypothetical protein
MDKLFSYLFILPFLIWASYSTWKIIDLKRRRKASTSWPLVIGTITEKRVAEHSGGKGGRSFTPKVTYAYSILGTMVTKTLSLESNLDKSVAEETLNLVGHTVHARYNPQNPKVHISDLEQVTSSDKLNLLIALLFLIMSVLPLLFGTQSSSPSTH